MQNSCPLWTSTETFPLIQDILEVFTLKIVLLLYGILIFLHFQTKSNFMERKSNEFNYSTNDNHPLNFTS